MPEAKITRKTIIVVDTIDTNQYGDLTWTDKEGKEYKVKSTRKQYFEAIQPARAVEISWSSFKGTEYPYSVVAVAEEIAKQPPKDHLIKAAVAMGAEVIGTTNIKDRSVAISYAKDLAVAGKIELKDMPKYANSFLDYILKQKED